MTVCKLKAGTFQMAALQTDHHSLRGPLVLRFSLSYRDVEELVNERGLRVDHTTIWRWVQRYGPELNKRFGTGTDEAHGPGARVTAALSAVRQSAPG